MKKGIVYLVGAGPGDPGLITVKGVECIRKADVVVYDYLANEFFLNYARSDAEIIYAGKKIDQHTLKQEEINELLAQKALAGNTVCRLKGGDPFLFGRGGEEALHLREKGVDYEVVPGISAAIAVPAYAGIPVTHRGYTSTFAAITGHEDPTKQTSDIDWSKVATGVGTLVFFMGVRNLPVIAEQLIKHGRPASTPVALVRYGSVPAQETVVGTIEDIAEKVKRAGLKPPALIIVGEVVALREKLKWFESRPLFGKRVIVTRARAQASDLAMQFEQLGAEVIEFPTIRIEPPLDKAPLVKAVSEISDYDWVVLTSVNGVDALFGQLRKIGLDARAFASVNVCAIGPATTARLLHYGIRPDLIPPKYVAESILETLKTAGRISGRKILLPRADIARSDLHDQLAAEGATVTEVVAYRTVPEDSSSGLVDRLFDKGEVDLVTFTSSSTAKNFVTLVGKQNTERIAKSAVFASIGPITSKTMQSLSVPVHIEAEQYDIPGLLEAVLRHFTGKE